MRHDRLQRLMVNAGGLAACAVVLTACGGGSGDRGDGLTQMQREDIAASSWPGMLVFAQAQINTLTSENAEPRPIAGIDPPQSETDEPAPI
jgi:hypothetical protein